MTDRIDHVEDARVWINAAERPDIDPEFTTAVATIALAHATLALAEQQRIANLIALATSPGQGTIERAAAHALIRQDPEDHSTEVRPEIREALGL